MNPPTTVEDGVSPSQKTTERTATGVVPLWEAASAKRLVLAPYPFVSGTHSSAVASRGIR
ncbi:hypothetical protein ACFYO2_36745 [Streptomyces sp. NPDC006602]|uniref:hypothetical protein n=1 Tax=Streptomyces sp. NPDC006602 TaxID=3364751 RepID=UPI0036C7A90F